MKLKSLSFLIIVFSLNSCNSLMSVAENVNKKDTFETKESYLETINKKAHFPTDKLIILNDNEFNSLMTEIISKRLSTYYGIANKNYFVSAEQLSIKSCSGQIKFLYQMFIDDSEEIKKSKNSEIALLTNLNLDNSKNTVIFLYSYKLGGLANNKISTVITELEKENNFDYRIISLDNYDIIRK